MNLEKTYILNPKIPNAVIMVFRKTENGISSWNQEEVRKTN